MTRFFDVWRRQVARLEQMAEQRAKGDVEKKEMFFAEYFASSWLHMQYNAPPVFELRDMVTRYVEHPQKDERIRQLEEKIASLETLLAEANRKLGSKK